MTPEENGIMRDAFYFLRDHIDPPPVGTDECVTFWEQAAKDLIGSYDFVSQDEKDLWISCLSLKKYGTAGQLVLEYFWKMAEDLKQLDPSDKNQKNYDLIIRERSIPALAQYVQYCDYNGFEKSMDSIRDEKDYLAAPDWEGQENTLQDMISQLFGE